VVREKGEGNYTMTVRHLKKFVEAKESAFPGWCRQLLSQDPYSLYLLVVLLAAFLLGQINQYMLAVVARPMAQQLCP